MIDEIQRIPGLLNEVHRLIENRGRNVVMSGASARKLRRDGVNLLAARALGLTMHPLTSAELEFDFEIDRMLQYGSMPETLAASMPENYLHEYADTYLTQEILAEALVRKGDSFARFLEVAARQNGQPTNTASIARDVGVTRNTVVTYFDILKDTLIGGWTKPWKPKPDNNQLQQSKFYFCDTGIARGLSGRVAYPPTMEEQEELLETFICNELRAFVDYSHLHYPIHHWRTYDGAEVDFVVETRESFIGIEVKSSDRWSRKFNRGLSRLARELPPEAQFQQIGVFGGSRELKWDDVRVVPIKDFLKKLWNEEIIR